MILNISDNAGTFDRLIPLLPSENGSYLCLDLLGHGMSSRLPHGVQYHVIDNLIYLNIILQELKIEKVSLLGHSLGSIITFLFSSVFPEKVNFAIGFDSLKPHIKDYEEVPTFLAKRIPDFMKADARNQINQEPPLYTYEDMVEKWSKATFNSITKETVPYLLKRNIRESSIEPGKFYFTRDNRVKFNYFTYMSQEIILELAKKIIIPYLFLKASNSTYFEKKKYYDQTIEIMKQNPQFELHYLEGTHHMHLTQPEIVAPVVSDFIKRHWKPLLLK